MPATIPLVFQSRALSMTPSLILSSAAGAAVAIFRPRFLSCC